MMDSQRCHSRPRSKRIARAGARGKALWLVRLKPGYVSLKQGFVGLSYGLVVLPAACAGSAGAGAQSGDGVANARRDTEIRHEACDTRASGAERLDANGDGRVDVTIVRAGGREICRAVDLNFDGVVDTWVYRDEQGKVRRRENDYNRDGRIDEITLYRAGVPIEKHRSTSLGDKLDTWEFFEGGVLSRTERDSDGDEMVDQWWEYPQAGCPVVHSDLDGDGRPDPGATVDYCKEAGYVPPQRQDPERAASPDFSRPGSLPTELDNKPQGEGDSTESKPQGDKP